MDEVFERLLAEGWTNVEIMNAFNKMVDEARNGGIPTSNIEEFYVSMIKRRGKLGD